ncbi:MAG: DUF1345 domain-containing protein, partial [Dermatophilaceae bacterium]
FSNQCSNTTGVAATPDQRQASLRLTRLLGCVVVGILAATVGARTGQAPLAAAVGGVVGVGTFLGWTWWIIGRMSSAQTQSHATREDTTRPVTDAILLAASLASLAGVAMLLLSGSDQGASKIIDAAAGMAVVATSWVLVHTMFTLRYASLYYDRQVGGIDFNQSTAPAYRDFAYLAFTIGMTYQVSDTDLQTTPVRLTALRHGLLAFLFGTVILATTINLVVQLASSGTQH